MALSQDLQKHLQDGAFIPAHPLALTSDKQLDEYAQRRLTRYYIEAGVGGIAVGVHTTQFEIRDPQFNLYEIVLRLALEEVEKAQLQRPFLKIAGVCGGTEQALEETKIAKALGYDMVLLSNGGLHQYSEDNLIERTKVVANELPVFGFYLQPAVGGRIFSYEFWEEFASVDNVVGIKMAPFDRYLTLDVIRAVCASPRKDEIALYTGNDDNIVLDLFAAYQFEVEGKMESKSIVGGLLGHWSVWTHKAVKLFEKIKQARLDNDIDKHWFSIAQDVTDANSAFFDSKNAFKGSIAGINEVLSRQGLLQGNWCLIDHETLSPGQANEIDRVYATYPQLNDDAFVQEFLRNDKNQ
ncbi:dihydrodipicolinate synthase family protein [Psychrobacillus psychrodurans]|uniref:dihydrodipicolinate synthase family protein n=1 Tax=Psychrobacillus psychrodurans TaxID=126157 RepID=UPI0008F3D1B1|nr:dihydrodipicolinate synthase family protein [Psychrobacillus psychrodurans]MCZ8539096.1 dihydrodipicolinate synthase family protein [Psychrobacillus psychrodurans]SFM28207.1 Dihydrodipicolinate synthase/N-acetylneuraminate lyase [Psychrobacillus psychrodurans]